MTTPPQGRRDGEPVLHADSVDDGDVDDGDVDDSDVDDGDVGWGDPVGDEDGTERYLRERPPHYGD